MIRTRGEKLRIFPLTLLKWRSLAPLTAGLVGFVTSAMPNCAGADEGPKTAAVKVKGIEHVLYLAVRPDPASPLLRQAYGQPIPAGHPITAKFVVSVRISAHSQETNFFGTVPATVAEFDLAKGSKDQPIWRDGKCHHERGYPKISVTGVEGLVTSGQEKHSVAARWRVLGLFLPRDEVLASKRIDNGTDNIGSYIATRTETKQSRLFLDLKLYILQCDLAVTPQRGVQANLPVAR